VIFILYFWVTAIIKSYQKTKTKTQYETYRADSLFRDSLYQDSIRNDTSGMHDLNSGKIISNEEIVDGAVDYNDLDAKVEVIEEKKKNKPAPLPVVKEKTSSSVIREESRYKEPSKPATKPKEKTVEPVRDLTPSTKEMVGDGGTYLVMAGSYLLKENAEKMRSKLKTMGYTQAEIMVFPASEYHSVVAVRYSSESKAQAAASELKRKGIDSFVKSK